MQKIVVTSSSHMPRFCAGTAFSGAMSFDLNHFTAAQLHAIINDRLLTVVVGEELTADRIDDLVAYAASLGPVAKPKAGDTYGSAQDEPAELVSGLAVYPAGGQAAVLPAAGGPLVDPANAGGTLNPAPHVPEVVVHAPGHATHHKGKAAK